MYYLSLQSNSSLQSLVLSSMKWSLPCPARPKTRLKINETRTLPGVPKKAAHLFKNNKKTDKFGFTIFELLVFQLKFWYIAIHNRL